MFELLVKLLFTWLPSGLYFGVWAVISVAFLIIMVKILTVLISLVTSIFRLFIP